MTQNEMKIVEEEQDNQPQQGTVQTLDEIRKEGREVVELTDVESQELSRYMGICTVVGFARNDLEHNIQICQEDIKHITSRLEFERQRLDILEKNLTKVTDAHNNHAGKVDQCLDKVALRLGREATDFKTFGVYFDESETVTHIVDSPKDETEKN